MSTFADAIEKMCGEIGFNIGRQNDDVATVSFDMGDDRDQTVWITPMGTNPDDELVISITSPALNMSDMPDIMLGQKTANNLLRENAQLFTGSWAVEELGEDTYLVAVDTQIMSTCDPEELRASILTVAHMADNLEKQMGVDNF